LIMLETARLLIAEKQSIALLTMIDSFPALRHVPIVGRFEVYKQKAIGKLGRDSSELAQLTPAMNKVKQATRRSLEKYNPTKYVGKIRFIRASTTRDFPNDPASIWSRWIRDFDLESVPGDHRTILTDHAKELGKMLTKYLNESVISA
jgi:thioesterase domain-containing protein